MLQRLGRVVEQAKGIARGAVMTLEQQRQDEPCGRRADRRGQELLGKAHDRQARLLVAGKLGPACRLEGLERTLGALDAEIFGDRVLEVVDGYGRAETAKARHRACVARHEYRRLDALERHRCARQRAQHIKQQIDRQAPQDAVVKRVGDRSEQRLRPQRLDAERAFDRQRRVGRAASEGKSSV